MDPITMKKFQEIKRSKKHHVLENVFLYSLIVITCSLLCSSPFWFPSMKSFLIVTIPKFASLLLTTKLLFILGNIIVLFLIGESKLFASQSTPVYYEEYVNNKSQLLQTPSSTSSLVEKVETLEEIGSKEEVIQMDEMEEATKVENFEKKLKVEDVIKVIRTEELNKRANDLIARVNRQRRLEERLILYGTSDE